MLFLELCRGRVPIMNISNITGLESIATDLKSNGKMDVLSELGDLLASRIQDVSSQEITKVLVDRERLATTGVGSGVAIPHGKLSGINSIFVAFGISKTGIDFGAVDNAPVHIFVALIAPLDSSGDHLRALAQISRLLKDPDARDRLKSAGDGKQLLKILEEEDGKS